MSAPGPHSAPPDRDRLRQELVDLLEPVVTGRGAELVDVELVGGGGSQTVRLLVHREPGIAVELCEAISREVSDLLDVADPLPGRYRLEVTSPGLDRPLRTDADLRRARGRLLKAVLTDGRTVIGRLSDWSAKALSLEGPDGACSVARERVARATIEAEFK